MSSEEEEEEEMNFSTPSRKKKKAGYDATSDLSGMMNDVLNVSSAKKRAAKGGTKKKEDGATNRMISIGAPFLMYQWKDRSSNNRLTLEVLLFGAVDQKKINLTLGEASSRSGCQSLCLSNPLPPAWLSMQEFENNIDMTEYNNVVQHGARKSHLVQLEENHFSSETNQILSHQEFNLPFIVENFKDENPYEGTGYYLEKRHVVKRSKKNKNDKVVDIMNVLVVQMVSEEKCAKKKSKKVKSTVYTKPCTFGAESSDDEDSSSSDEGESGTQRMGHTTNFASSSNNNRHKKRKTPNANFASNTNFASRGLDNDSNLSYDTVQRVGNNDMSLSFETAGSL